MTLSLARLATTKSSERTLSSGVLEHPTDPQYGKILYIIDIPLPLVTGEAVEHTILNTIKEEYFDAERKTPVYQFEDCMKQVNLALAELAEDGKSDWVGHIHSCVALWVNNELYVTYVGRVVGMLVRGQALVSIIDPQPNDRRVLVHKTYANLVSGQLDPGDGIILGNGEVARHFSPQFLSQTSHQTPLETVHAFHQTATRLNVRFINAIIGRVKEGDDDDFQEIPSVLLGNRETTLGITPVRVSSHLGHTQRKAGSILQQLSAFGREQIKPVIQNAVDTIATSLKKNKTIVTHEDTEPVPSDTAATTNASLRPPILKRTRGQKIDFITNRILAQLKHIQKQIKDLPQRYHPKTLLIAGMVLVVIVGISAWRRTSGSDSKEATISKQEQSAKIQEASAFIKKSDELAAEQPEKARDELTKATQIIDQLNPNLTSAEMIALRTSYASILKKLNNVILISTTNGIDIDQDTNSMNVIGQYLFSTRLHSADLYRQTLGAKNDPQVVATLPNTAFASCTLMDDDRTMLAIGENNKIFRVQIDGKATVTELLPPTNDGWPKVRSITNYEDNIYILESGTGQLWKYTTHDKIHYTNKQSYYASASLINKDFRTVASDGFIYLMTSSGDIKKLLKGSPQSFGPLAIPRPGSNIENAQRMFTNVSITSLYIQDKNRIIEASKDGQYIKQLLLPNGTISTSFVSPKSKRAWITTDNKLIEIDL